MAPSPTSSPSSKVDHVIHLLNASAHTPYIGEPISQLEHSLQCAHLAATAQPEVDNDTVVAALLHDIGQFVPAEDLRQVLGGQVGVQDMLTSTAGDSSSGTAGQAVSVGRVGHDALGAQYLASLGFNDKVSRLVGSHVAAKRYLCAVDMSYHATLSDASKKSLEMQGGPMLGREKDSFGRDEWCEEMCRLRKWDDAAKEIGLQVPQAEDYKRRMLRALTLTGQPL